MSIRDKKIVVIGGGAAGIAAATKLIKNGFSNVTILEAENRIGGRVHSVSFGGSVVDLGAQWVHGEDQNVVYEMVKDMNLLNTPESSDYESFTFFTSDGLNLDTNLVKELCEIAFRVLEDATSAVQHNGTLFEYFNEAYNKLVLDTFGGDNPELSKLASMVAEWANKFVLCLDPAESLHQMWSRDVASYTKCEGNQLLHWGNRGYGTIFDVLLNKIRSDKDILQPKILLKKEVTNILWDEEVYNNKGIIVKCTDGTEYYADHVIVTVSVGVLKKCQEKLFSPKLPEYKVNCINHIPFGNVIKILLKFPKKWWPDDVKDFSFLWTEEDKATILTEFSCGPTDNDRSWLEDIFGFYTVDSDPQILLGWVVGPMTKQVELLDDEEIQRASMFLLRKFVGNKYKVIEPESMIRSQWGTNAHFYGTYSYTGTEMEEFGATREDLAKPLSIDSHPVVLFAGEATHSKYFSTVHGAIESGYREADRILNLYKDPEYHKVIVVGGGMAGLGAATQLVEKGVEDFIILEADNRPGGRIRTIFVDNKALDLGAQWLHGKDNPLYKLAKKHNLLSDEMSEEGLGSYVRSNGEVVDEFTVKPVDFKIGQILEECAKLVNAEDYPYSLADYLEHHFNEFLQAEDVTKDRLKIFQELYDWHVRFQVIDNSCKNLSRLSARSWGDYVCLDDAAHYNLKNGYQSLIQVILDELPNDCIKCNCEVTKVIRRKDDGLMQISLSNGQLFTCDHLIVTFSLGVLKQFSGFGELLSNGVVRSIEAVGFAGICKIYLFYEEKWWNNSEGFQLLWTEDCSFPEKESWLRSVTGFDEVVNHPNALMTWVGGDAVKDVENIDVEEIGKQCTDLLQKFLCNNLIPYPKKVIRTKWLSNPLVKGSYCHITPECDGTNFNIRTLGKPILLDGLPRIILAGEAVHPSHYSTTHGAFESGQEQANIIADYILKNNV